MTVTIGAVAAMTGTVAATTGTVAATAGDGLPLVRRPVNQAVV